MYCCEAIQIQASIAPRRSCTNKPRARPLCTLCVSGYGAISLVITQMTVHFNRLLAIFRVSRSFYMEPCVADLKAGRVVRAWRVVAEGNAMCLGRCAAPRRAALMCVECSDNIDSATTSVQRRDDTHAHWLHRITYEELFFKDSAVIVEIERKSNGSEV